MSTGGACGFGANRCGRQRGSMAILVVGLFLPLLFFLFSLSLDFATYYTDQAKVQAALDETALYAYRFLPNVEAAQQAAISYSARFTGLSGLRAEISDSTVLLRVDRRTNLTFARLVGVTDASLPLSVVSRVRGAPIDSLIVLDTSQRVAPRFNQAGWGSEIEWPAAQYFDDLGGIAARAKTQRCFNPIFSALKHAAVDAYRYLGASSVNSLGLGFYTGAAQGALVYARGVSPLPMLPSSPPEVPFVGFADPYVGPALCAAAAETESNILEYQFPSVAIGIPARGDFHARPNNRITPGSRSLDPAYSPYLQGDELIWSQPSTETSGESFGEAFRSALLTVASGDRAQGRGGLVGKPTRMLLWLTSQLPVESGVEFGHADDGAVRAQIQSVFHGLAPSLGSTGLTIFFVVLRNPYLGFDPSNALLDELRSELENAALLGGLVPGTVTVRVLGLDSVHNLTDQLARWMAVANKTTVVAL